MPTLSNWLKGGAFHLAVSERQGSDWLKAGFTEKPKLPLPRPHCNQITLINIKHFKIVMDHLEDHLRRELERCDLILNVEILVGHSLVGQVVVHGDEPQNVPHLFFR